MPRDGQGLGFKCMTAGVDVYVCVNACVNVGRLEYSCGCFKKKKKKNRSV